VRSTAELAEVAALVADGLNDCEISRRTGIPRTTIRDWRNADFRESAKRRDAENFAIHTHDFAALPRSYAYLLGLYLGDGCISRHPRDVHRLRIALDNRYPMIVGACQTAMAEVMPSSRASIQCRRDGCVEVYSCSKHWPCLFPQHGPGPKHKRRIALADWQHEICAQQPELLVCGLIHSDGCRSINRIKGSGKVYEYPRYEFTNHSADIRHIFCHYLDALGIAWRPMTWKHISIARRDAVAKLDAFVGPKA
jgi:Homeodomain-like domain